jgi:hypothetical protein
VVTASGGGGGSVQVSAVVENFLPIAAGRLVAFTDTGTVQPGIVAIAHGIAVTAGNIGDTITVQLTGKVTVAGWGLTPGSVYFNNPTGFGTIQATPPLASQNAIRVGVAVDANTLDLDFGPLLTANCGIAYDANGGLVVTATGAAWGAITGTLTNQTDLATALAAKAPTASPVLTGTPVVRNSTGTPGTDEIQVSYASGLGLMRAMGGKLRLAGLTNSTHPVECATGLSVTNGIGASSLFDVSGNLGVRVNSSVSTMCDTGNAIWNIDSAGFALAANFCLRFSNSNNAPYQTKDTGLGRSAPKVLELNNGTVGGAGGTLRSIPLTWTVTGTVNDANPGVARRYRLSGSSTPVVTGISISQVDGQEMYVCNPNATAVTFNHQAAGSTAANRIICTGAANITLNQDEEAVLWYDATTSRWRMRKI